MVFPLHAIGLPCGELLLPRADVEKIRSSLAARVTPEMLTRAEAQPAPAASAAAGAAAVSISSSGLMRRFLAAKEPSRSEATKIQMRGMCGVFVELMADPDVHTIDRALISKFRTALTTPPSGPSPGASSQADLIPEPDAVPVERVPAIQPWPATLPEQVRAVAKVLEAGKADLVVSAIEARFKGRGPWKCSLLGS